MTRETWKTVCTAAIAALCYSLLLVSLRFI
jgi:hypothetical protein